MNDAKGLQKSFDHWLDELIDSSSSRSPSLNFKPDQKTGRLRFLNANAESLYTALRGQRQVKFRSVDTAADDYSHAEGSYLAMVERPKAEIESIARNLKRRADEALVNQGVAVLYVAFGTLIWRDDTKRDYCSPLLMLPVELERAKEGRDLLLRRSDDDVLVNPVLNVRLEELGVKLPAFSEIEELSYADAVGQILSSIRKVDAAKDWQIEDVLCLSTFSFSKESMYRDLKENKEKVLNHPIVKALGTLDPKLQTRDLAFEAITVDKIDEVAPPETTPLVLDADSSQRVAIAEAARGHSFVMDGPPGTGKSQTIANMISVLLNQGKTVLFVSEKMAALEVVRNRLAAVGLGGYLLELHSHKVNRKEVAKELLNAVGEMPKAPNPIEPRKVDRAKSLRKSLNDYALALQEERNPAEMSVHKANGLIAQLGSVNVVSTDHVNFGKLTLNDIEQVFIDAERIGRNWHVYTAGDKFIWRGVTDSQPLEPHLRQGYAALEALRVELQDFEDLRSSMNVTSPHEVERLISAVGVQADLLSGGIRREWLIAKPNDYKQVLNHQQKLLELLRNHGDLDAALINMTGLSSTELENLGLPERQIEGPTRIVEAKFEESLTSETMSDRADLSTALGSTLSDVRRFASGLSEVIGFGPVETILDARAVATLAGMKKAGARFPATWVRKVVRRDVEAELNDLSECINNAESCEAVARRCYTDAALALPVADLQQSVAERNWFVKIFSALTKEQTALLRPVLRGGTSQRVGLRNLTHLQEWQQANEALTAIMTQESSSLIDFGRDPISRFNEANLALKYATAVAETSRNEFNNLVGQYFETGFDVYAEGSFLSALQLKLKELDDLLAQVSPRILPPEVLAAPISAAADWLSTYGSHLEHSSDILDKLNQKSGRGFNHGELVEVISAHAKVRGSLQILSEDGPKYERHFGESYKGIDTDLDELASRLERAGDIRKLMLSEKSLGHVVASPEAEKLQSRYEVWCEAAAVLNSKFEPQQRTMSEFGSQSFAKTKIQLDELLNDLTGQQHWFDFNDSRNEIEQRIGAAALNACLTPGMTGEEIAATLKKTLLVGWLHDCVSKDSRLQPVVQSEREAMVKEYRSIDLQLLGGAVSGVIRKTNARRNDPIVQGEFTVITSQGQKKTRHLPVRTLISQVKSAAQVVKPVFMMSPGAVSQYLPPDMEFDVVIFDEASQVKASDAINCIYRGRSLILAGDERQLPPTAFFERSLDADEDDDLEESSMRDYESVLGLAKGSGALKNLGLRWHYRSKHENLIAYSNSRFYDGSLITFPSAAVDHPDFGVEMIKVDGVYGGGGARTNPLEAEAVAARVMHHYLSRPNKSLGVVTMSKAQMEQVSAAVEKMRLNHPELDGCFEQEGRLDNFFVRAIEEVQGDERDVIIMSIGYGPDVAGKVHANFGPIGKTGGERRLNVAITRARERLEVVTSMTANDIAHSKGVGASLMKSFLDYAERGLKTLALPVNQQQMGVESPFEEMVMRTITNWGYEAVPQVGAAGYRIDIGVCHPDRPGQFVLAVECDGYQYHSSPAARDRDRLRDQILVGLGWTMHRIWGTSWHRHRADEERRLKSAIENAIAVADSGKLTKPVEIVRPLVEVETIKSPPKQSWAVHYTETRLASAPASASLGTTASVEHLKKALADIVKIEAPVHFDLVHARIRDCFNIGGLHKDKKRFVRKYIPDDVVVDDDGFLVSSAPQLPLVRTQPDAGAKRSVSQVHKTEVARALYFMAGDLGTCTEDQLMNEFKEFFGWRLNQPAIDLFRQAATHALESNQLRQDSLGRFAQVGALST